MARIGAFQLSFLLLSLITFTLAQQELCTIKEVFPGTCNVKCTRIGVGLNTEKPGEVAANFLVNVYPTFRLTCVDAWVLEITDCIFPEDRIYANWFDVVGELPAISSLIIQRSGDLSVIDTGAFSRSPAFGDKLQTLAIYYNRNLKNMYAGFTDGLTNLKSLNWVGNAIIDRADVDILRPFFNTIESMHIGDCGMTSPDVLANLTGSCQTLGTFPNLRTIDLGYNPGPGLSTISSLYLDKLNKILSLYLWSSDIERLDNNTVFDPIAESIQYIDLSNNKLTTIKEGTLNSIISYGKPRMTLKLAGNPWHCDCHLEWLQVVIRFALGGIVVDDNPRCASPPSEKDKLLIEADMAANCPPALPDTPIQLICHL